MAGEKIKVEEATISEIVVAGSDCQFWGGGGGEEVQQQKQQVQASAKSNHKLQQVADYQPGDHLKKEHKYSSFCQSSKRWTIKLFSTLWI